MIEFIFASKTVEVSKVNPRGEMHGDKKELGTDLNIIARECAVEELAKLGLPTVKTDWRKMLYDKEGVVLEHGVTELVFDRTFEDHEVKCQWGRRTKTFTGVKICKFKAVPTFGHTVTLHFQIQLSPQRDDMAFITDGILHPKVSITTKGGPQGDLANEPPADDKGGDVKKNGKGEEDKTKK